MSGADEALASFHAERSDVVVTDLKMPGKSGIEFLRELRAIDGEVPVVVLTAHGTVATAVEAMKLGAVDYLQKPFDVDALELVIRRALDLFRFKLLVFGAPVAAALPVLLAIARVTVSLAGLYFVSGLTPLTYCLEAPHAELRQLPPEVVADRDWRT